MANIGLPWSVSTSGYTIQPVNGEFSAWSQGVNVPPDGWTVVSGKWASDMAQCQGTLGPYAVDFGSVTGVGCLTSEDIAILPATKYLLSAYYRISSGSGSASSQGVRIDWYDESRTLLQSTNLDLTTNTAGAWTAGGLEVTSPNGAVYARVLCGRFNVQGSTDFQLDSVKFDRKVYIPTGTVSMDDVADGPLTYARPLATHMDSGRIKEVLRGTGVVATDYLFKKPNTTDPDTLDAVPNGTTFARVNAAALSSGNPKMDSVVDGTYGKVLSTALSAGNPKMDAVVDGTYGKVLSTALSSGNPKTDSLVDGTYGKVLADHLTSGAITSLTRAGVKYATSGFFNTGLDNLGSITDGGGYAKVNSTAVSGGNPKTDSLVDGTYSKVLSTYVTSGAVSSVFNGTSSVSGANLFNKAADNLGNITDGGGYAKVNSTAVSAGNPKTDSLVDGTYSKVAATYVDATTKAITTIRNTALGVDIAGSAVFRKGTDTFASVAGTIASGQFGTGVVQTAALDTGAVTEVKLGTGAVTETKLGTGAVTALKIADYNVNAFKLTRTSDPGGAAVGTDAIQTAAVTTVKVADSSITTSKVADLGITGPKLNDGVPLSAYDEATPQGVYDRSTATNCTKGTYETGNSYIRFTVGTGTLNPQVSTTLYTGTGTNARTQYAVMRYRLSGGFTSRAPVYVRAINNASTGQTADAVFLSDGSWHTAVFDISGWTVAGTLRVDLSTALSATGYWDIAYLATGNPGSGTGALISNAGNVGVGTASPGMKLHVNGTVKVGGDSGTGGALLGFVDGDNFTLEAIKTSDNTVKRNLALQTYGGNVGIGTTNPGTKLDVVGSLRSTSGSANLTMYHDGTNAAISSSSTILAYAGGANPIIFHTNGTEKMRVDSGGNVGIGTTGPSAQLHVKSADSANTLYVEGGSGVLSYASFGTSSYLQNNQTLYLGTSNATPIIFRTNAAEVMRIQSGGNVGIGKASPGTLLDVQGYASYRGNSYVMAAFSANSTLAPLNIVQHTDGTNPGISAGQNSSSTWQDLTFLTSNTSRLRIKSGGNVIPGGTNTQSLGESGTIWKDVWAGNATIQTSDERQKTDIETSDLGLDFIESLRPVRYRFKAGQNVVEQVPDGKDEEGNPKFREVLVPVPGKRPHYGFLAQQVKEAMGDKDFAGYVYDAEADVYAIRYGEFIAPLVKAVQELSARLKQLESKLPTNQA